uniref:Nidogen-2 n=1 Tax=Schizaphis graminum TaxID=13262 RepID=A0A2S2PH35_SCHGA
MCIDINECMKNVDLCDIKTETCINLPGRYKCICRWGFQWSTEQQICVPDMLVKSAEIRFVCHSTTSQPPNNRIRIDSHTLSDHYSGTREGQLKREQYTRKVEL